MNSGQMLEDVRLAVNGRTPIEFYGRMGGVVPFPDEILAEIQRVARETPEMVDDPVKVWLQRMEAVVKK
jgi:2-oxoglutarate ferredoxin oxidoreductase subunit alpha